MLWPTSLAGCCCCEHTEGTHLHPEGQHKEKTILSVAFNSQIFSQGNRVPNQVNESEETKRQKVQQPLTNVIHLLQKKTFKWNSR